MRRGAVLAALVSCVLLGTPGIARAGVGGLLDLAPPGAVPGPFPSPVGGQFADARPSSLTLYDTSGAAQVNATLWAKHQDFGAGGDRLALGIDIPANPAAMTQTVNVYFDNNDDGRFEPNEDALTLTRTYYGAVTYSDMHQVDPGLTLAADPVDADISAAAEQQSDGHLFVAFAHRLCTGDPNDLCVTAGTQVGFAVTITDGDGRVLTSVPTGDLLREDLWNNVLPGNLPAYVSGGSVAGSASVGSVATVTDFGAWNAAPAPGGYTIQWQRCRGTGCSDISGANSITYAITAADVGYGIRAVIRALNQFGTSAALALPLDGSKSVPPPVVNGLIYFERADASPAPGPRDDIWSMRADGSGQKQIGAFQAATNSGIAVAPDGHTIAYSDGAQIYIQDGPTVHTLAGLPYGAGVTFTSPAWSHDGQWIAFSRSGDVGIVHPDGSGLLWLGANGEDPQSTISWSPDDSQLVYSTTGRAVTVVQVATGTTQTVALGSFPSWGPAGQIAYSARIEGQWRLHVYDPSTGSNRTINSIASDVMSAWSPDGTTLLFSSDRVDAAGATFPPDGSRQGLWTLPADGSTTTATPIDSTVSGTWDMFAAWGAQASYSAAPAQFAPVPDGRIDGDYPGASPIALDLNGGSATLYSTRVASRLYLGFVVPENSPTGGKLEVQFDSNRDGVFDAGDAVVGLDGDGTTHQGLFNGVTVVPDALDEVEGAFGWSGGSATYELSVPLCGGNPGDMCLSGGDAVPFEVNYVDGYVSSVSHAPASDPYSVDQYALLRIPAWQDTTGPALVELQPVPDGAFTDTTAGAVVRGRFADLSGVASATVSLDGTPLGSATRESEGFFSFDLATQPLTDGRHTITWDVVDGLGNHATYSTTEYVVFNPPAVAITSPSAGDQVLGDVTLQAQISSVVTLPLTYSTHVSAFAGNPDTSHTPLTPDDNPAGADAGVFIHAGVTVNATGSVNCGVEGCDAGPDGRSILGGSAALSPADPAMGLLARVGTSGPWTFVGAGPKTISGVGELYFAVNDGYFFDNGGPGFDVSVTVPSPLDPLTTFAYSADKGTTWIPIGGSDGASPSTVWSTGTVPDGTYLIRATSTNARGPATSNVVSVDVANALQNLKMELPTGVQLDPAIAYDTSSWQVERETLSTLLTFPDSNAPRGGRLEPELAREIPTVENGGISADGLTYTFHLRTDFQFADGTPVTAYNIQRAFERALASSDRPGTALMQDLAGAAAYTNGLAATISGVSVLDSDPYTIAFHLTKPDADFLQRASMPFFGAVPTSTPIPVQTTPIVTSGPYSVTSQIAPGLSPGQVVLERNPYYAGSRGRTFHRITIATGVQPGQMLTDAKRGDADYVTGFAGAATTLLRYGFETGIPANPDSGPQAGSSPASYSSDLITGGSFGETFTGGNSGWSGPGAFSQNGWGTDGWFDFFTFTVLKPVRVDSIVVSGWENMSSWSGPPGWALEITPKDGPLPGWQSPTSVWSRFATLAMPSFGGSTFNNTAVTGPGVLQPGTYAIRFKELSTPDPWTGQLSLGSVRLDGEAADGSTTFDAVRQSYGPGSPAAAAGEQQYFTASLDGINYLALNTARGPFSDPTPVGDTTRGALLRRAVAAAIDRTALANAVPGQPQVPTDQIIPPRIPGYVDNQINRLDGADTAKALDLITEAGGVPATPIVIWSNSGATSRARAAIVKANLEAVGFTVTVDSSRNAGQLIQNVENRATATGTNGYDITLAGWINDYADPFDDLDVLLNGRNAHATDGNLNLSYLDDPTINAQLDAASALTGKARTDAYAALDLILSRDYAAIVPYSTFQSADFFSQRIGCQLSPFGISIDLGALCDRNHLVIPTGVTVNATADPNVTAGAGDVNIDTIPLAVFDPAVAAILGVPTTPPPPVPGANGADTQSAPVNSLPVNSLPVNSLPVNSLPVNSLPVNSLPVNSLPVNSLPVNSLPVNSLPVNSLPIDYPGGWPAVLAGTSLDGVPLQTVTLPQVFGLNPAPAALDPNSPGPKLTLGELDLSHSALGEVPFDMLMLGGTTVDDLGFSTDELSALDSWCAANHALCSSLGSQTLMALSIEGAPVNSLPVNSLPVNSLPVNSLPVNSLPVNSLPTSASPVNSLPVNSLDLTVSPIGALPLQEIVRHSPAIAALPVNSLPVNSLPVNSLPATATLADAVDLIPPTLTVRDVASALAPFTLGDLNYYGTITIGQLVQGLPAGISYGDILAILLPRTALPWENVRASDFGAYEPTTSRPHSGMSAGFVLQGAGVGPATVDVTLPDGFHYVANSAHLVHEGLDAGGAGEPEQSGQNLVWSFGGLTYGDSYSVDFQAYAGTTLGATQFKATVSGTHVSGGGAGGFDVGDTLEPNDTPALAPVVAPDTSLQVSYISHSGDVDYYRVHMPATKGTRVLVHLANVPADFDLALFSDHATDVKPTTTPGLPLQDATIPDQGVSVNNGQLTPASLQDVPDPGLQLLQVSNNRGTDDEDVALVSNGGGDAIIAVFGYNGASSPSPYTLRVTTQAPQVQSCTARSFDFSGGATSDILPSPSALPAGTNTLILVNEKRLGDTYGAAAGDAVTKLHDLAGDERYGVRGVVVPVELIAQSEYDTWDQNPCNSDNANAVAQAIAHWVDAAKAATPSLKYVVIAGGDDQIPFFRIPDLTRIANEAGFATQFARNEYFGSLSAGDLLSDDPYLDTRPIPADGRQLFVPDLVGGRLVEKPDQIAGAVTRFEASHGNLDAGSAFVSGYDFVSDGSQRVASALAHVRSLTPRTLITDDWHRSTLLDDAFGPAGTPPAPAAINDWNGHFDNYRALPADGSHTDVITTADVSPLSGGLFFTMGCHAGFQTTDAIVGSTDPGAHDWAETLAAQGTQFVGNTGYGLGNTDSVAFSEELMAGFASNLGGASSVGEALAQAKRDYFLARTAFSAYDEKTLAEATFYGLPMYAVGQDAAPLNSLASDPLPDPVQGSDASASPSQGSLDPLSGTSANTASFSVQPHFGDPVSGTHGQYFTNGGQVQAPNYRPLQPYVSLPASRNGEVAHGVILDTLASRDVTPFNPSNVRPTLDLAANEPEPQFTDQAWPSKPATLVSLQGAGSLDQQLNLTTGQFFTEDGGTGVERLWTSMSGRVTYSASDDFTPPTIDSIDAYLTDGVVAFSGHFSDRTETGATGPVALAQVVYDVDNGGTWRALPLKLDETTGTWSASSAFTGDHVQYFVEACDGAGNCGWSSNKGRYYDAQAIAAPAGTTTLSPAGVHGNGDWFRGPVTVTAASSVGATLDVSVDGAPFAPATADGVTVTGDGAHTVDARGSDGSSAELVVLIDATPPHVNLDLPRDVSFGQHVTAVYTCTDDGSTIDPGQCQGTVPSGAEVDTSSEGEHQFVVDAFDRAGNETYLPVTYTVGPANTPPSAAGAPVAASPVTQKSVTLSWAPATDREQSDLQYTVEGHDSSTGVWSVVSPGDTTTTRTFDVHEGTWRFRVETSDGTLAGDPSETGDPVIVDASAPPVTLAPDRAPEDPAGGWFRDGVDVVTSSTGDPNLQDGSPGSGLAAVTGVQTVTATSTVTGSASDNATNSSTATLDVRIDALPPSAAITCPSGKLGVGDTATATFTASDGESGLATADHGSIALDTSQSGRHTVSTTARDRVGHETAATCDYVVNSPPTAPGKPFVSEGASPNDGRFILSWTASTDPDGDPLTYTVKHADAHGVYSVVRTTTAHALTFSPESEGTWTYVVTVTDGQLGAASQASAPVVVDQSNPNAPTLTPARAPEFGTWFKDSVAVATVPNGDSALLDGSPGSGIASVTPPQTITRDGHDAVTGTATDFVGHSASTTRSFDVDSSAPAVTVTCPATVILNSVATASWRAADSGSGLATAATGTVALDTSVIGTFTSPAASATDNVGHVGTGTCSYAVIWPFSGFFAPVNNLPTVNSAKAGSSVPVKFGLGGDRGLGIFAPGYPAAQAVVCATDAPVDAIEAVSTAGSSGLQYDAASGQYTYVWKTSSAWATGTCRDLILKLADGTTHRASFKWK